MINDEKTLNFDMDDIKNRTKEFETKFAALTILDPGNKVGIDSNNNLYAEYFQQPLLIAVIRRITGQKREDINEYLNTNFLDYEFFLLFIINAFESCKLNNKSSFDLILVSHKIICVGLVSGLISLKKAYPDYQPILDTCDKYIDKFNLFRGKSVNLTLPFNEESYSADAVKPGVMKSESK